MILQDADKIEVIVRLVIFVWAPLIIATTICVIFGFAFEIYAAVGVWAIAIRLAML